MTTETIKPITWKGGSHPMTLDHPWVRNVLSVRGLPGDYGSTPAACFKRFEQGIFGTDDVERIIELGLIGGGMSRQKADDLVERFVRRRPVLETSATAFSVLATLFTTPDDLATAPADDSDITTAAQTGDMSASINTEVTNNV